MNLSSKISTRNTWPPLAKMAEARGLSKPQKMSVKIRPGIANAGWKRDNVNDEGDLGIDVLALSGKVRESQVWILHTYGLLNLRNSQMQSWAKCNARGHSHFSPWILKVQGCVVPARSNFRINLHITRQRKRNSYFPNGDVGILPPTFSGITISSLMPTSAF